MTASARLPPAHVGQQAPPTCWASRHIAGCKQMTVIKQSSGPTAFRAAAISSEIRRVDPKVPRGADAGRSVPAYEQH
jgi:hypothetical protein